MPSTLTSPDERGFSLIELLVALTILLSVLALTGAWFAVARNFIQEQILRTETQQGLRATLDTLARDLRLGGACLPVTGSFMTLAGTNAGSSDQITTRTGLVQSNLTCVRTTIRDAMPATSREIKVQSTDGFADGMRAYLFNLTNGTGEFFTITHVQTAASMLQKDGQSSQDYPVGSGVYAVDERTYGIDPSNPSLPVLTLTVNGGSPVPFASGVETLSIRYELLRNCPPAGTACDIVDLPPDSATWRLVNQILISATVRSRTPGRDGQYYRRSGQLGVKPRNLLPGTQVLGSN